MDKLKKRIAELSKAIKEAREELAALNKAVQDQDDGPTTEQQAKIEELAGAIDEHKTEQVALEAKLDAMRRGAQAVNDADAHLSSSTGVRPSRITPGGDAHDRPVHISVHDNREDDPALGWRNIAEFATAVHAVGTGQVDERLHIGAATGMNQASGSQGGFLVPPRFSDAIWDGLSRASENLLGRTDQYTVDGESLTFNANAETSRAAGSRWGGTRGYWISEAAQHTASKPTFRQVKIEPQELAVFTYATDKLLRNSSTALEQYLTRSATDEIAFLVGDAIVNGDGVGKPLGILNAGCAVSVAKESGQNAATLKPENLWKMMSRLHPACQQNAVWLINQDVLPQLLGLSKEIGTAGVYLAPGTINAGPYVNSLGGTLLGKPVVPVEYCATLGTVGDIILVDLSKYVTGMQGSVRSAMSIHLKFDYAETAFRFMFAVDGRPWLQSAITPYKGTSNTLSSIVTLATRS